MYTSRSCLCIVAFEEWCASSAPQTKEWTALLSSSLGQWNDDGIRLWLVRNDETISDTVASCWQPSHAHVRTAVVFISRHLAQTHYRCRIQLSSSVMSASELYLQSWVLFSNGNTLSMDAQKSIKNRPTMVKWFVLSFFLFFLAPNDENGLQKAQVIKQQSSLNNNYDAAKH